MTASCDRRNKTVESEVKSIVIADSAKVLEPIEKCLGGLGLKPDRMIGVSYLPPDPLPHDLSFFESHSGEGPGFTPFMILDE